MKPNLYVLIIFVVIKFTLHLFIVAPEYDLHRDEYLHLDQANHLAAGYQSVPPFNSWIALIIKALGNGEWWVRFFPALFGALTLMIVWKTIDELKGGFFAQVLAATGLCFSVLLRINILFQPNSADIFFWTICSYFLIRYIRTDRSADLLLTGFFFGLGLLNKYSIGFWAAGIALGLLLTEHRKLFFSKHLYFAAALALIIFLPNLIWQINNDFPVVGHMRELTERQLVNVNRTDFIREQFLFFIGSIFVWVAGLFSLFRYRQFYTYRFFGWGFIFTMALFILFRAKGYYAIGIYPILFAFGSIYIEHLTKKAWLSKIRYALPLLTIFIFIPVFKFIFPVLSPGEILQNRDKFQSLGLLRWEDGMDHHMPQDFADMLGWKELAARVDKAFAEIPEKEKTIVFCDNYGQAGAINYYSKFRNINAVTFNADYRGWFPWEREIRHAIRIKETEPDDDLAREKSLFESVEIKDSITDSLAREYGTRIIVLKNANTDITEVLKKELQDRKNR